MIEISEETIERISNILAGVPKGAERALSNSMNRGITKIKTGAFKEIKQVYAVQSADLSKSTTVRTKNTSTGDIAGYVNFSGVKIPLYKFNATPKHGKGTVKAGLKRGSMTNFENAFVATMASGHVGIFERTGEQGIKSRKDKYGENKHTEKVREIMGLSAPQMIGNEEVITSLEKEAQEVINKRLEHEVDRLLNGYGG